MNILTQEQKSGLLQKILLGWDVSIQPIVYAFIQLVGVDESLRILPAFTTEDQAITGVKYAAKGLSRLTGMKLPNFYPNLQLDMYALTAIKLFDWKSEQQVYDETSFLPKYRPFSDNLKMVKVMDLPCNDFINTAYYYGLLANAAYNDSDLELLERQWNRGIKWMQPLLKSTGSNVLRPRFMYFYDHHMNTIVLLVRGTSGFSDIISDACIKEEKLSKAAIDELRVGLISVQHANIKEVAQSTRVEKLSLGENCNENAASIINNNVEYTAHSGFMASARNIIYERCAAFSIIYDSVKKMINEEFPRVRVVGHSLGAGTAACIVYLLKQTYRTSDIRGICFAPPPCFSHPVYYDLQNILKDSIVTFVNRWDAVTRAEPTVLKRSIALQTSYDDYIKYESQERQKLINGYIEKADTTKTSGMKNIYKEIAELRYPKASGTLVVPGKCFWLYYHRDADGKSVIGLYNVIDINFFNILPPVYFEDEAIISLSEAEAGITPEQYTVLSDHSMTNYLLHLHYTTLLTLKK